MYCCRFVLLILNCVLPHSKMPVRDRHFLQVHFGPAIISPANEFARRVIGILSSEPEKYREMSETEPNGNGYY